MSYSANAELDPSKLGDYTSGFCKHIRGKMIIIIQVALSLLNVVIWKLCVGKVCKFGNYSSVSQLIWVIQTIPVHCLHLLACSRLHFHKNEQPCIVLCLVGRRESRRRELLGQCLLQIGHKKSTIFMIINL
jgi:hypothetical protein